MRRAAFALVALFATFTAVGCGTISNQHALGPMLDYRLETRHQRLYGGIRSDGEMIGKMYSKLVRGEPGPADPLWGYRPGSPSPPDMLIVTSTTLYLLADIPLSLVADTILLPWDVRAQWLRLKSESEKPKAVLPSSAGVSSSLDALTNNPVNNWSMTRHFEMPHSPPNGQPDSQR